MSPASLVSVLTAEGWKILAYNKVGDLEGARSLFNKLQIPFKEGSNNRERLEHPTRYPYNEPLTTIQLIAQDWLDKIAQPSRL